jgi:hypothetical protein
VTTSQPTPEQLQARAVAPDGQRFFVFVPGKNAGPNHCASSPTGMLLCRAERSRRATRPHGTSQLRCDTLIRFSRIMALGPSSQTGPCRVEALPGSGGMGEVYRVHDTREGRWVDAEVHLRSAVYACAIRLRGWSGRSEASLTRLRTCTKELRRDYSVCDAPELWLS